MFKKIWESKTVIAAVLNVVLALFVPDVSQWIKENPEIYSGIISSIMIALRFATTKGLALK